jgi:capsular exopolysaccharide synthesis family protein
MDLVEHFRVIAHNWWRILLASALVGAATYAYTSQKPNVYQASALLNVTAGGAQNGSVSAKDQAPFLASTYSQLATTKPVLASAAKDSRLGISEKAAEARVSASSSSGLGFVTIDGQGPQPEDAARLANAVASAVITAVSTEQNQAIQQDLAPINQQVTNLQAQLNALPTDAPQRTDLLTRYSALLQAVVTRQTQPRDRIDVVSSAAAPSGRISPNPTTNALLAFVIALVITAELVVALRAWGDRFSANEDPEEVARFTGLPLLGAIPSGTEHEVIEAFRTLRTNVMVLPGADRPHSVAVVSENANAGKSFISTNLARSSVALETQVVLIDADLRRPSLHHDLRVPLRPGLSDVLNGRDVGAALHPIGSNGNLRLLPSGSPSKDPASALSGNGFHRLLESLEGPHRLVVVDSPPARLFADALNVSAQCDATIFVVDLKTSRRRAVRRSVDAFQRSGAKVLGVVVNRVTARRTDYYYDYTRN